MMPFHPPGQPVHRAYGHYSARQEAIWQALADFAYATQYGFGHTRMPAPGAPLPAPVVKYCREKVLAAWNKEAPRDPGTTGDPGDVGWYQWQYLCQRLDEARKTVSGYYGGQPYY